MADRPRPTLTSGDFEAVFENSSIAMGVCDPQGRWLRANAVLQKLVGYSEDELRQLTFLDITHPDDRERDGHKLVDMVEKRIFCYHMEKRYIHKSGRTVWIMLTVTAVPDATGKIKYQIGQIQDITELKTAYEELGASAKLASLGKMASGIAHEINNPLSIICGYVNEIEELLEEKEVQRNLAKRICAKINSTCLRMAKIIAGLRIYAQNNKRLHCEELSFTKLLDETLAYCDDRFKEHGIKLLLPPPALNDRIYCSPVEFSQVLLNLFNNAVDAVAGLDERWIEIKFMSDARGCVVKVVDSGKGIPHDIVDKITDPFFSTKAVGKGLGLGLSICQGLVARHNGRFYVDQEAKNTTFVVELPPARP